jgi:outer membrane protein assembly factor BamB
VLERRLIGRRAALALPLALSGCGLFSGEWFAQKKPPLPGKPEPILHNPDTLSPTPGMARPILPPPVRNAAWLQAGGNPAHDMGQLALSPTPRVVWTEGIGAGGGYRNKILAEPLVWNGTVFAMDTAENVSALRLSDGHRLWQTPTRGKNDRSPNVGGGLGLANGVLYAANGLGDFVALDPVTGRHRWRIAVDAPLRSGPTLAVGRVFLTSSDDRLFALDAANGRQLWTYQAQSATASMLGRPSPAFADGIVVAAFGSGELTALRADGGTVVWTDVLASSGGGALADIASIRGRPAIHDGRVFAIGMGGIAVALDLHAGRRLWEREVAGEDSPWVAGDWVFLITLDQQLAAVHAPDGLVAWVAQLPAFQNETKRTGPLTWFGPLLAGDRLVVSGTNGEALAVSPYTGQILGRQRLPSASAPVQPVVAEETLLLVAEDGRVMALR